MSNPSSRIDRPDWFGTRNSEITFRIRIPAFGDDEFNGTRIKQSKSIIELNFRILDLKKSTNPGFWTTSLKTRTASSFDMFSKLISFTCRIISPGSIRPSKATAPLFNDKRKKNDITINSNHIRSHMTYLPFHNGTDINATIAAIITLANDRNTKEIHSIHIQSDRNYIQ